MATLITLLAAYLLAKFGLWLIAALTPLAGERGPTHDAPHRDSERHRGGRVDQHHEAR